MQKVLLISYYYPPYTGIEANRIVSWAQTLSSQGYDVTVLTRQWEPGAQHNWSDYFSEYSEKETYEQQVYETLRVIRVPYRWGKRFRISQGSKFSLFYYWLNKATGHLQIETDTNHAFSDVASKLLDTERFDFIIVSSPPLNIVKLGVFLKKRSGVPLIVDFRDSYNNHLLNPNHRQGFKSKLEDHFFVRHLRKWLRDADLITSVSQAVLNTLPISSEKDQAIIMNGYEDDAINRSDPSIPSDLFTISVVGSLYTTQDLEFFSRGIAEFIKRTNSKKIQARFIGIKSRPAVRQRIEKFIPEEFLFYTDRVSHEEAIDYMHSSTILLQCGWKDYKGYCPAKVFEYLAAKRNILVAPGDGDLTDAIVKETSSGRSVHTETEMVDFLIKAYEEWQTNGYLAYHGNPEAIEKYSRHNQNLTLVAAMKDLRTKKQSFL